MKLESVKEKLPSQFYSVLEKEIKDFRPSQEKSIKKGLLERKNLLVCTPTASGKTLIAELAMIKGILQGSGKGVFIVPLKALATEKYRDFKRKYSHLMKIALSIGDLDANDPYLADYDLIVCTSEKLDSLTRHRTPWLSKIGTVVVDEIHLMNDSERGPTLEILLTILKQTVKNAQIIGLSATIGNAPELAEWLEADLVVDEWRPVKLHKGIYLDGEVEFY